MFTSIRWRFIFVYFMLVFVAMIVVGVFIINALELQQKDQIQNEMLIQGQKLKLSLNLKSQDLKERKANVDSVFASWPLNLEDRIYLIEMGENPKILASAPQTSEVIVDQRAFSHDEIDAQLILQGVQGVQLFQEIGSNMHFVYPLLNDNEEQVGLLYMMTGLKKSYELLDAAKKLFLEATLLALVITIILGYLVARSITKPINAVTLKAEQMAQGDFNQYVDIESNDEIGQLGRMFNFLTQELKKSMAEIQEEKSKLEAILYYMADGLLAVNKDGMLIHANLVAQEMFKIDPRAIDTYRYQDVVESIFPTLSFSKIFRKDGITGSQQVPYDNRIFKVQYAPFYTTETNISGLILLFQDMTEEEKLERLRRDFVANVSHELKTPLTTIKSYTETILDGVGDVRLEKQFLETINSECDRMNRIVRELLDLSSMDHKQKKWRFELGKPEDLVLQCVRKMELSAKEKKQTLTVTAIGEIPKVSFDYDGLEQVVLNIISNAIKYTQEEGTIHVQIYQDHMDLVIEINDNGIGIAKEDMGRIFERFYRVDKARSRALGGTGLGLSIAKEIMEAHHGKVEVESAFGTGTSVFLKLPVGKL